MNTSNSLALIQSVIDNQKNMICIFNNSQLVLANKIFLHFFSISSLEDFALSYRKFEESFVMHPTYFNAEKIPKGQTWLESILKMNEHERIVSMMTSAYEPHAFSVDIQVSVANYIVTTFTDITQSLIKRILIENNANIDIKSGAYDKHYFSQVAKSYDDAASFNEKIIAITKMSLNEKTLDDTEIQSFVSNCKKFIREDDMLVRWSHNEFSLVYLVDDASKAEAVMAKLSNIHKRSVSLTSVVQNENENIETLIQRLPS